MTDEYTELNRRVQKVLFKIPGAKVVPIGQLAAFRDELLDMQTRGEGVQLIFGLKLSRLQPDGRQKIRLELQVVTNPESITRGLHSLVDLTEQGVKQYSFGDVQKILGGSDVGDMLSGVTAREAIKMTNGMVDREVMWVARVPRLEYVAEVVKEFASSHDLQILGHRPRKGGAAIDYSMSFYGWGEGTGKFDDWKLFEILRPLLLRLGVPGVKEATLWLFFTSCMRAEGVDYQQLANDWLEWISQEDYGLADIDEISEAKKLQWKGDREKDSNGKKLGEFDPKRLGVAPEAVRLLRKLWSPPDHCVIQMLQEIKNCQKTETARERVQLVLDELSTKRNFLLTDRIRPEKIKEIFKFHQWPCVIACRFWRDDKKRWDCKYFPQKAKDRASQMNDPDVVIIDCGLYLNHFFWWEEDVTGKYGLKELANCQYPKDLVAGEDERDGLLVKSKTSDRGYFVPAMSTGGLLRRLFNCGFLRPLEPKEKLMIYHEKAKLSQPIDYVDYFVKKGKEYPDVAPGGVEVGIDAFPDIKDDLMKKFDNPKLEIHKNRIFAGDTESFIDPKTGEHVTSLLIIKHLWNEGAIRSSMWSTEGDCVRDGMKEFLRQWKEQRTNDLKCLLEEMKSLKLSLGNNQARYDAVKAAISDPTYWGFKKAMKAFSGWHPTTPEGIKVSELVDALKKHWKKPIIYFHHLGYDIQPFLSRFKTATYRDDEGVMKGAIYYSYTFKFQGELFELRNSLTLITTALKNFPKMFLTKEEQKKIFKEVYAYKAINENLFDARVEREGFWVTYKQMEEAINDYETGKSDEEKKKLLQEILETAKKPEVNCVDEEHKLFNVGDYIIYYCERDVDLLRIGLKGWDAMGQQDTSKSTYKGTPPFRKFDTFNFLSAPAIAQALVEAEVREPIPEVLLGPYRGPQGGLKKEAKIEAGRDFQCTGTCTYKYMGMLREFMLLGTTGGRCTLPNERAVQVDCLDNPSVRKLYDKVKQGEKLTDEERQFMFDYTIQDFDARSLYPTAMSRSFIPLGCPEFFRCPPGTTEELLKKEPLPDDAFYVIKNVKYDKKLAMPCNCWKQKKPEPRCRWTNEVPPEEQLVRKQTDLLTMMEVQGAHFEILGGCKWTHGKCTKIQDMMKALYDFRRLNHSNGFDHPIQEIAKLLMNSYYGKNVTKMRKFRSVMFALNPWQYDEKTKKFFQVNGYLDVQKYIKSHFHQVEGFRLLGETFEVKVRDEDKGAYDACFGCEVLAGSRALICRVSAAIEDITKSPPLYTDTDSLHVFGWQIGAISEWFQKKFGIPMIGGELGQFHPDFEPQGFKPGEKFLGSVFFCGVGKKVYIDEVFGDQGSTYFHKRAKGIRAEWLSVDEYIRLYNGEVLVKDCDECGGVNIRPKNGVNYSVHLIKKVRKTAAAEVEVEDQVTTVDNKLQVVNSDGDLEDFPSEPEVEERTSTPSLAEAEMTQTSSCVASEDYQLANKRARENNPPEEDDDTIEIIYDPESDEEHDEPIKNIEIIEHPAPKKIADEVQKNVQRWLRDFDTRDKIMMYETLKRFLAGGEMSEDDWFFLGRLNANNDDQVYAREAMRQLQQDLQQVK